MKQMDRDAEKMLAALAPAIDEKCAELKKARAAKRLRGLFITLCVLALLVPTAFVVFGISLSILLVPVIFTAIAFFILLPILINQQGGHCLEQI